MTRGLSFYQTYSDEMRPALESFLWYAINSVAHHLLQRRELMTFFGQRKLGLNLPRLVQCESLNSTIAHNGNKMHYLRIRVKSVSQQYFR